MQASKKKKMAEKFINFLHEPENAAQLAQFVYYATPNNAAEKLLPKEFLADPTIYPSKEVINRSEFNTVHPPRVQRQRNAIFNRVTRGKK